MNGYVLLLFFLFLLCFMIIILSTIALWGIFLKAGKKGWEAVIPFYNQYIIYQITWGNGWLFLLSLIPVGGVFVYLMTVFKLAKVFHKGTGFGFGLLFLPLIFTCLLAFDKSSYHPPDEDGTETVIRVAVIGGGVGLIIGIVALVALLVFGGRTRVEYQEEPIRQERARRESREIEERRSNRMRDGEDRYEDYEDEDEYEDEREDYQDEDFERRGEGGIDGNPFDLTPRPGFEIMQIYSDDGTVVLDVPVGTERSFVLDYDRIDFGNHGIRAEVTIIELGGNLRTNFMAQMAIHADVLGSGDWYFDIVMDEEIHEIENGIMRRLSFQFEQLGEIHEGFEYHMAFVYQDQRVYVILGMYSDRQGPKVDCYIKTLKHILGFHHFLETEIYLCFYCDPANRDEQEDDRVEARYSLQDNPFDLTPQEGFHIVPVYSFCETVRLDVPVKIRGTHQLSSAVHFDGDGVHIDVRIRSWASDVLEALEWEMDINLSVMDGLHFFSDVEVSEVYQIENGAMQRITFLYSFRGSEHESVEYVLVFDYLGTFIVVNVQMLDIWDNPDFEELADFYRQMFGVNHFLD